MAANRANSTLLQVDDDAALMIVLRGWLLPLLLALPLHRLARRVLRLEPRPRRPAAIGRIGPLRHDALQPHAADVVKYCWAVTRQMFIEPDGSPLGPAEQSGEPSLAVDQWQIAQVVAVMLDQVEGKVRVLSLMPSGAG